MGGTVTSMTGPAAPTTTDQKYAGLSRAAHRQYRMGPAQKRGRPVDMAVAERGRVVETEVRRMVG